MPTPRRGVGRIAFSGSPFLVGARGLVVALALFGYFWWGYHIRGDPGRYVLGLGIPLAMGFAWARFPTRPPSDRLPGSGRRRLLFEAAVLGGAVAALATVGRRDWAGPLLLVVVVVWALSWDRVLWLATGHGPAAADGANAAAESGASPAGTTDEHVLAGSSEAPIGREAQAPGQS